MRALTLLAVCAAAACPAAEAPLLVRHHTAIFVAGPILSVVVVGAIVGINMLVLRRSRAGDQIPLASVSAAWCMFGGAFLLWFWTAFGAGFTPEYVQSLYVPANATLVESSQRTYPCTKVTDCSCAANSLPPCDVVDATLLQQENTSLTTAPCAGGPCCAQTRFRCTTFRTICSSRHFCSTSCSSGVDECVQHLATGPCTAKLGECYAGEAKFKFQTNKCVDDDGNDGTYVNYSVVCVQDPACVKKFVETYITAASIVLYYAPWDDRLRTSTHIVPKGQTANIVLPLVGLAFLCFLQLGMYVLFVNGSMGKMDKTENKTNKTENKMDKMKMNESTV